MLAQGAPFTGINVADDFPSGDCTARASQEIADIPQLGPAEGQGGGIPEMQQSFERVQTPEERARQLDNIKEMLSQSPEGQQYLDHIRQLAGEGEANLDDVRTTLAIVGLNRLAVQVRSRDDIAYIRNGIDSALRAEAAGAHPDENHMLSLFDRLNEANAALAVQEGRVAETVAGARAAALRAEEVRKEQRAYLGGLAVSLITNMVSGGAGGVAEKLVAKYGAKYGVDVLLGAKAFGAVKYGANFLTDNAVGGALNYGEQQFAEGAGKPGEFSPGAKSAATNFGSSVAVRVAEHYLGGPLKEAVPNAAASAAVQAGMDEALARATKHNSNKP